MAEVVPFTGIQYNPELIGDMAAVVAPPYDVITPEEQDAFYARHPHNVIRLIMGKNQPGDNTVDNVPIRSARTFEQWLNDGVLVKDPAPAFYLTTVDYTIEGRPFRRFGLIGCVRLEPFEKGIILPHERTFSKVKSERLLLRKACHANFSSIFGLYQGGTEIMGRMQAVAENQPPSMDLVDDHGHRHRLWRLDDDQSIMRLSGFFGSKRIYIADGHHRYETALNYRKWVQATQADFTPDHPANYVMMSLSSMADPGLTILPAHRLIRQLPDAVAADLLRKAPDYFDIVPTPLEGPLSDALDRFKATLGVHGDKHAIGLFSRYGSAAAQVMVLKEGVMARLFAGEIPGPLLDLDVTVLTHLVMMRLMGLDQAFLDDETTILYRPDIHAAVRAVGKGDAAVAFILNPTRIEQVRKVAEHGLIMPRKSTYFYPKVICGQVFNRLRR